MSNFKKLLSVAGLACLPGMAFADTPTIGSILEASGIAVTGYTSASYSVNFNDGKTLGFRAYDAQSDTFTIDQASITLAYAPESGFGATVNFLAGEDSNIINANYGDGDSIFSLPTAYVSYAGGGFTVIAGRFGSLAGYEVTADNAAPFGFAFVAVPEHPAVLPHRSACDLQVRRHAVGHPRCREQRAAGVDDRRQQAEDAGSERHVHADVDPAGLVDQLPRRRRVRWHRAVPDQRSGDRRVHHAYEHLRRGRAVHRIDKLTLALNGTLQDAKDLYINKGVAFYGMYQVTEQFAARARIELTEAAVKEAAGGGSSSFKIYTVAGVYSPSKHMDIITEVRYDTSNDDVFPNGLNAPKDTGGNFAVKAIYKF